MPPTASTFTCGAIARKFIALSALTAFTLAGQKDARRRIGDLSAGSLCRNLFSELSDAWILSSRHQMPVYPTFLTLRPPPWHTSGAAVEWQSIRDRTKVVRR